MEFDGVETIFIPQCEVCKHVDGKGCKAFEVEKRDSKYYDRNAKNYERCERFEINEKSPSLERYKELNNIE